LVYTPAPSQLQPGRLGPTDVCGDITEDTIWEAEASPYIVNCNVTVKPGVTLFIAPGTVVKFARRSGLYIDDTLQVLGTEELPVFFTSLVDDSVGGDTNGDGSQNLPVAGGWDFVQFNARSNDDNSIIEHMVIRYSGGDQGVGAIRLQNASPILRNISFEKNRLNGAEIATNLLESDVWDNTDVVYVLLSSATIGADQTLTIAPGMVVKFGRRSGLYIDDTLQVLGTEELPAFFTSLVDDSVGGDTNGDGSQSLSVAGGWDFVQFNARSNDDNSAIEHLVIRYSGGDQGLGAIRLQNASPILRDISFEKNRVNGAEIATPSLESDVWDNTGVVYVVLSNVTIPPDQALTIAPGMVVKFARRAGLYVDDTLQVLGTAEMQIYFTSLADDSIGGDTNGDGSQSLPTAGGWDFLQFNARSDDDNSLIEYVVIRYSGGDRNYGAIRLQNVSPTLSSVDFLDNLRDEVEILN
jgi:dUTPase